MTHFISETYLIDTTKSSLIIEFLTSNSRSLGLGQSSQSNFSLKSDTGTSVQSIEREVCTFMDNSGYVENAPQKTFKQLVMEHRTENNEDYSSAQALRRYEPEKEHVEHIIYLDHSNEGFKQDYSQISNYHNTFLMQTVRNGASISVTEGGFNNRIDSNIVNTLAMDALPAIASQSLPTVKNIPQILPTVKNIPTKDNIPYKFTIPSRQTIVRDSIYSHSDSPLVLKPVQGSHYLLGRRTVLAYTLSSGYLLRNQGVRLDLGGQHTKKGTGTGTGSGSHKGTFTDTSFEKPGKTIAQLKKAATAAVYFNSLQKNVNSRRDRFSGGKLMFSTYFNDSLGEINKLQKNVNGRLPNILCDFLVPLMTAGLVEIQGHIAYDIGSAGVFVDVPLSLHVMISPDFLSLSDENSEYNISAAAALGGKGATSTEYPSSSQSQSQSQPYQNQNVKGADQVKAMQKNKAAEDARKELVAHANDLLLW